MAPPIQGQAGHVLVLARREAALTRRLPCGISKIDPKTRARRNIRKEVRQADAIFSEFWRLTLPSHLPKRRWHADGEHKMGTPL